jgi:hypothetical protein
MNQENYCSLNVAKRLIDTGIVLETEAVWRLGADGWKLLNKDWVTNMMSNTYESYPAPSFAEIWRELPEIYKTESGIECRLQLDKIRRNDGVVVASAQYVYGDEDQYVIKFFANTNPVDALAELLIWVKGQEEV